ncbi:hypothetical protein JRO89_XS15G0135600 [Xanthoceras sorbifolium]|uniref:Receptor-like serine/threonine-protein kinase n=1 Tax=Xanthoceras sorbifolium TaxID=99658 RepID=A0ABQ8H230_9ROSI|nr:hypothetical protein JRO89_XS15G0135600 [Xanthoceras sorbifolium]
MLVVCSFLFFILGTSAVQDTITPSQSIRDGQTLVSAGGTFELGFFSPGNSTRRYLGIWYKGVSNRTVAWVANRETPLTDHSGVLKVTQEGILVLDGMNRRFWSSNTSRMAKNPVVQLLDSGNLAVKDGNDDDPENFLWQSFDHPTDNLLPGMKLGRIFSTGLDKYLSSWKSSEDPASGQFSLRIDPHGFPQLVIRNGSALHYRAGSWNGLRFAGTPKLSPGPELLYRFELNNDEVYYEVDGKQVSRLFLNQAGFIQRLFWTNQSKGWADVYDAPENQCDIYSFCGAHARCKTDSSPVCACLDGFEPESPEEWSMSNWSKGCVRMRQLNCEKGDEFPMYIGMKLPDTSNSWLDTSMSLQECGEMCSKNCSCRAYANSNISQEGSGCLLWFGNLTDMIEYAQGGQDFYIRIAAIEKGENTDAAAPRYSDDGNDKNASVKKQVGTIVGSSILAAMLLVGLIFYILKRKLKKPVMEKKKKWNYGGYMSPEYTVDGLFSVKSDVFSFGVLVLEIVSGKKNWRFSHPAHNHNLLGHAWILWKEERPMELIDDNLGDSCPQSEVLRCIHVGLLCVQQRPEDRPVILMLGSESSLPQPKQPGFFTERNLPETDNSSSSNHMYSGTDQITIIEGSPCHDKVSNPVYYSAEVAGNRGFSHTDYKHNLLGHAWRLWNEERAVELIVKSLDYSSASSEILQCIHVGLLCVQQGPEDRPNMSTVALMLGGDGSLPHPKQPGFFTERNLPESELSSSKNQSSSTYEISISLLEPR